jgi:hypothetical protein
MLIALLAVLGVDLTAATPSIRDGKEGTRFDKEEIDRWPP